MKSCHVPTTSLAASSYGCVDKSSTSAIDVIRQLQTLFVDLLKSKRKLVLLYFSDVFLAYLCRVHRVVDTTGFVDSLQLQHDRQQVYLFVHLLHARVHTSIRFYCYCTMFRYWDVFLAYLCRVHRVVDTTGFVDSLQLQHDRQQVYSFVHLLHARVHTSIIFYCYCTMFRYWNVVYICYDHRMLKSSGNCFYLNSAMLLECRYVCC